MTSRMTVIVALATIGCFVFLSVTATAQTPLTAQLLRDGVYWVSGGSGANTGFLVTANEVTVIDAKMTEETAKEVLAEIGKVTSNPVSRIILTHSDGDHVNGLAGYPEGLPIIAHASTSKDMGAALQGQSGNALSEYLPTELLTADRRLNIDGLRVNLLNFGPAHTSGDLIVHLPEQRIAFVGDLVFLGRDPLIHAQKGGTSLGLVETLREMLALDADTYISGHNDPLTKDDIRGLLTSLEERQAKVQAMIEKGNSLEEVKIAFGVTESPQPGGQSRPGLIDIIYRDMAEQE